MKNTESKDKNSALKEILINNLLPFKYKKSDLNKTNDEGLVMNLKTSCFLAERDIWRGDIIRAIIKIDSSKKEKDFKNSNPQSLIKTLIETAKKSM
jgi:hypothetical protein